MFSYATSFYHAISKLLNHISFLQLSIFNYQLSIRVYGFQFTVYCQLPMVYCLLFQTPSSIICISSFIMFKNGKSFRFALKIRMRIKHINKTAQQIPMVRCSGNRMYFINVVMALCFVVAYK